MNRMLTPISLTLLLSLAAHAVFGAVAGSVRGFDNSRLDTLFPTMPISWRGALRQYVGRLHRIHHGKKAVRVFDYVDAQVPMLGRMFEKRLKGYRPIG